MALNANATMIFDHYEVTDDTTRMIFLCPNPGGGENSYYSITFTDTEFSTIATQVQLRNAVITKLQRKLRASNVASKLDQFVGQSVVI